ncbi:Pre-mRNA-splicing factor spp2 [Penicillium rolfsii]|nr:Pre-mRNA-splicing factor spp2 [Penicillium rolfsii]
MSSSRGFGDQNGGGSDQYSHSASSTGPAKKAAFAFQSRGRPSDPPTNKSRSLARRPHRLDHDDDSSDEERAPAHEEISGFDTLTGAQITADGQAVTNTKQPLVIPVTSKNNWRDRPGTNVKRGKKNLLPQEVQAMQEAQKNGQAPPGGAVDTEGPSMAYGLSFAQKPSEQDGNDSAIKEDQPMPDAQSDSTETQKPLTEDQIALQALLRETSGGVERRTDLVIESSRPGEDEEPFRRHDETSSFRSDVASRPEPATLDQYNAIPVEEFGAALLRGMGWKDGQSIGRGDYSSATAGKKAKNHGVPERRPGFLGIGAKDSGKGAEVELGAWGKSAMRKASRKQGEDNADGNVEGVYMPVTMRNKKTGEYITEEELADLKKESSKSQVDKDDWRERRDRNLEKNGRERDRDREYRKRDYDDDRSDRRNGSSRRDRSSSAGRHSSRRSRYDDDDDRRRDDRSHRDRDRHRERDKERRRDRDNDKDSRKDRDRERDRDRRHRDDRYSSSRHSSHSSRNDRHGDRDRDSHRSRRDD